jgi:hypothetical protein
MAMSTRLRIGILGLAGAASLAGPAVADVTDWSVAPLTYSMSDIDFHLGGDANGAAFGVDQPAFPGLDTGGVTGALRFFPSLERDYDSGLVIALHASILAFHDRLSNDRYDGTVFEKTYASVQTGLGTVEVGDTDGTGYRLAVDGPEVDEKTSLDNPEITFFRDPISGRALDEVFTVRTEVGSSLNFAKVSYYSPRLFGVQIAFSYAPSEGKDVIPFATSGPDVPNRQSNIWEVAGNYTDSFGPVQLGAYGALSMGHDGAKTLGHEGLTDWALGTEVDYSINDDWKFALGGAYREANAYAFDVNDVLASGSTRALHASTSLTYGSWIAGFEMTSGIADAPPKVADIGVHGYEASLGYVLNSNLQLAAGWQQLDYERSIGTFYSGPRFDGDAYFLHLDFHV